MRSWLLRSAATATAPICWPQRQAHEIPRDLICGILAGIGGFVYFLHVGSSSPSHASGAEMNAIASSIIGGTMLTGGVGNIIGTLFGVLSLSTIKNIVSSLGLDEAWWTNITVSAMICLFLVIQSLVLSRKNKDE